MSKYESHGYWHYVSYQQCARKGWFSNICGFTPTFTPPALLKGGIIHAGVAGFRQAGAARGYGAFYEAAEQAKPSFERESDYAACVNSAELMLKDYFKTWEGDKERFEFLAIEEELKPVVHTEEGEEFQLLVKPDAVAYDRERRIHVIFEVKHSGSYTPEKVYSKAISQDQATCYVMAWNQLNPDKPVEVVILDALYHNKGVLYCSRPGEIYRKKADLIEYELGLASLIKETEMKKKRLEEGARPISVFPRRGDCDGDVYNCDFKSICRTFIDPLNPPCGFKFKEKR